MLKSFLIIATCVAIEMILLLPLALSISSDKTIEIELTKPKTAKAAIKAAYIKQFDEKDYDSALAEYAKVITDFPDSKEAAEAQFRIANVYHWYKGKSHKALAEYKKVIDNYPDSEYAVESLVRIGSVYLWFLEEPKKAVEYYKKMLSEHPDNKYAPEAAFWMGEIYRWMIKDTDKAMEIAQSIVKNYPESEYAVKAEIRVADILREKNFDNQKAKEIYEKVIKEYPNTLEAGWALYHLGEYHQMSKRHQKAISTYKQVIEKYKDKEPVLVRLVRYNLGNCYLFKKDYEAALSEFKKLLDYSTEDIEALYYAGYKIAKLGSGCCGRAGLVPERVKAEAEELTKIHKEKFPKICEKIISKGPNNSHAHYLLGKFYFDKGEDDKAIEIFSKVLNMNSKDDRIYKKAHFYIAWAYAMKGQYEDAIREYKNILKYTRHKAVTLRNIAVTYEEAEEFANAKAYYNKVIDIYPNTPKADEARKRLKILERLRY